MTVVRRLLILSATAVALFAGSACGGGEPPADSSTTPPVPTALLGSGPTTPAAEPTTPVVVAPTAAYPKTAKAYAEAILAAWKDHQVTKLGSLTTAQVQEQLIEIPGLPNQDWHYSQCDGAAGSSYCTYFNTPGDMITLQISNMKLGQAHAGVGVTLDLTEYPSAAIAYVRAFIEAWQQGNTYRMKQLANQAEVDYFTHYVPPEPGYSTCGDGAAGSTYVRVYNADGLHYVIRVTNATLGEPHAISGHITPVLPPACV